MMVTATVEAPSRSKVDPRVMGECLAGDEQSWEELIRGYAGLIYSVALRYGLQEQDCADVFQAVCIELWRNLSKVREPAALAGWLVKVTGRVAWQTRQKQRVRREGSGGDDELAVVADNGPLPEDTIVLEERWAGLRDAVERLDPPCQRLIHALYFDPSGPSYEQVAARLGMPKNSLGPSRMRCFGKLRRLLEV